MINLHDDILTLLDANELYLMCHIAKRMSRDNIAFPSNETLLQDTGWKDKRTLNKVKKSLVGKGVLEISTRYNGEKQTSNNYKITTNLVGFFIGLGQSQQQIIGGAKNVPHSIECNLGGAKNAPGGGAKNAPLSINNINTLYKGENANNAQDAKTTPKQPKIQTDWKPAANAIITDKEAVKQIKEDAGLKDSDKVAPYAKSYFLHLKSKGEFYRLKIPQSDSERWPWRAKHIAGITQWALREHKFYPKRNKLNEAEPLPSYLKNGLQYQTSN
jgi:hypothetical protein